jgi:hypothetical protein
MSQFPFVVQSPRSPANAASMADRGMAHAAAVHLAESINRYWAELGYDAQARVVEIRILDGRGNADEFGVVSNLRNGIPSRRLPETKQNAVARPPNRS